MNTKRNLEYWVIPPEANGEFTAHMEDVLDVYSRPYNPKVPVLCMDEQPVQLVQETRGVPLRCQCGDRLGLHSNKKLQGIIRVAEQGLGLKKEEGHIWKFTMGKGTRSPRQRVLSLWDIESML